MPLFPVSLFADTIPTRGDYSKYTLPTGEVGKVEITWGDHLLAGVACSLDSVGYKALVAATAEVLGEAKPYAICGSLPLVRGQEVRKSRLPGRADRRLCRDRCRHR